MRMRAGFVLVRRCLPDRHVYLCLPLFLLGSKLRVISLYIYEVNPGGFFMILVVVDA
jgi:hypothetical protein